MSPRCLESEKLREILVSYLESFPLRLSMSINSTRNAIRIGRFVCEDPKEKVALRRPFFRDENLLLFRSYNQGIVTDAQSDQYV